MKRISVALMLAGLGALAACGGGDEGRAGLTADQERELDDTARMLDEADIVDASPDSLTLNEADFEDESAPAANETTNSAVIENAQQP